MTSCLRWSSIRRVEKVPGELGVLGVRGEFKSPSKSKKMSSQRQITKTVNLNSDCNSPTVQPLNICVFVHMYISIYY